MERASMLRNLKLKKYRSFDEYALNDLSRVNLLVGKNDCGKTSILEAIHFLVSRGDPDILAKCAERRGEGIDVEPKSGNQSLAEDGSRTRRTGPDVARFFSGHRFEPGEAFRISGEGCGVVSVQVGVRDDSLPLANGVDTPALELLIQSSAMDTTFTLPATETGCMVNYRHQRLRSPWLDKASPPPPVRFATPESRDDRLSALALALNQAADGFLLIDMIDTGLHWTVMEDMWRLVVETAHKSSAQVFATTHSYDCIRGLASFIESRPDLAGDVSIHKVERSLSRAVSFDAKDIPAIIAHDIEVR